MCETTRVNFTLYDQLDNSHQIVYSPIQMVKAICWSGDMNELLFNPFPKYLQIRDMLIRRMGSEYTVGSRLPTEHALCEEFGVSRETIREALVGLEEQGLIRRRRGQGTFLAKLPDHAVESRYTGLVEDFTELGFATESKVLESGPVLPPHYVTSAMRLPANEMLYRIVRVRYLDGDTLALHDAYLPLEVAADLVNLDLGHTTLFEEISNNLGRPLHEDFQSIDAAVADAVVSTRLRISFGAPLLVIRRIFGVVSEGPPLFFESLFRSDRYFYSVQLSQPPSRRTSKRKPKTKSDKGGGNRAVRAPGHSA